jgi:hypothetical protein
MLTDRPVALHVRDKTGLEAGLVAELEDFRMERRRPLEDARSPHSWSQTAFRRWNQSRSTLSDWHVSGRVEAVAGKALSGNDSFFNIGPSSNCFD